MFFLAVNYHYIHEEDKYPFPGIYPTPVERLTQQLDELGRSFEFIGQKDILAALEGGKPLPDRCCLITFDDGLRSQFKNALPLLKKKGIPAMFFISAMPLVDKKACLVHKIHWLRANLSPEEFLRQMERHLQEIHGYFFNLNSPELRVVEENHTLYRYDDRATAKGKFFLNQVLPDEVRASLMNRIFAQFCPSEKDFCRELYMSREQLRELYRLGFLGGHSYSHSPLSTLNSSTLKKEIRGNFEAIADIVGGNRLQAISYPYGHTEAVSLALARYCQSIGLKFGFTMERAFNRSLQASLLFARVDTNDAPGGKYPLFTVESGEIKTKRAMESRRKSYVKEQGD